MIIPSAATAILLDNDGQNCVQLRRYDSIYYLAVSVCQARDRSLYIHSFASDVSGGQIHGRGGLETRDLHGSMSAIYIRSESRAAFKDWE